MLPTAGKGLPGVVTMLTISVSKACVTRPVPLDRTWMPVPVSKKQEHNLPSVSRFTLEAAYVVSVRPVEELVH